MVIVGISQAVVLANRSAQLISWEFFFLPGCELSAAIGQRYSLGEGDEGQAPPTVTKSPPTITL